MDREQGVDFRGDSAILPDGPDRTIIAFPQIRDALFDLLIGPARKGFNNIAVGCGLGVPCPDQGHRDQAPCNPCVSGPLGSSDCTILRQPPPQDCG